MSKFAASISISSPGKECNNIIKEGSGSEIDLKWSLFFINSKGLAGPGNTAHSAGERYALREMTNAKFVYFT
jgi:hypothetical protein